MANNYWRGTTDTDGNTAANWSGGRVPTDTDVAYFDGDGLVNCSFSGAISCQGLVTVAAYTKAIDLDSADAGLVFTLGSSGMVLDNGTGSTFVCGAAVIGITGGPLDNYHATGWNENTSSITVNSTSSVTSKYQNSFYNLTFAAGSTVTIAADTPFVKHLLTLNSAVVLNNRLTVTGNGDLVINAGASFSGASYLEIYVSSSGHGLITLDPSVTTPKIVMSYPLTGSRLVAGTYAGLVQVSRGGYGYTVKLTLNAGTYNFNGGLTIANSGTQILTFDNSTNGPAISVTNLTIDIDSTSGITLDDSGQAVNWTITGTDRRALLVGTDGHLQVDVLAAPSTAVTGTFWQATQPVSGTFWQATQPISAAALPLPTGAATSALQGGGLPAALAAGGGLKVEGVAGGVAVPVSGTFYQATQPVSAAALPLPTGASTSALQGGGLPAALGAGGGMKVDGSGTALPVTGTITAVTAITNALPAGTNMLGSIIGQQSSSVVYDGATACTIYRASGVAAGGAPGTDALIAADGTRKFRILALFLKATAATLNSVYLATTTDLDVLGNAANPIPLAVDADGNVDSGFVLPWNPGGWTETSTVNEALNLISSAAQDIIWAITYIKVA